MSPRGPKRRTYRLNQLNAGINTMAEESAFVTLDPSNAPSPLTQLQFEMKDQNNWAHLYRGGLSKDSGFSLHEDTGVATPITGLGRYINSSGTSLFLYSQGTNAYKLVAGTPTSIATISSGAYTHFETAGDELIICDGVSAPQRYNGTTTANVGGSPPSGARQSLYTQNRLWMFSATSNHSLLYYSDALDINAGYSSNFVSCNVNDGQKITGIADIFVPGELRPLILVTKERSIGIIDGDGSAGNPFTFIQISNDLGVLGFRQVIPYEQDIAFLTPKGVSTYQTALKNVNFEEKFISDKVRNQFTALSQTTLPQAFSWYDWKHDQIGYAVATGNATYPNLIWLFNIRLGAWRKKSGFNLTAGFVDTDGTFYHGDDTGKIYNHVDTVHNYNSEPIIASFQTPYLDFYEPMMDKRIVESKITVRGQGSHQLGIGCSLDYGTRIGSTHTLNLSAGNYEWGGGVWTSNSATYRWGGAPLLKQKFYPKGHFENISFTVTQSGEDEPVDIVDWVITVEEHTLT